MDVGLTGKRALVMASSQGLGLGIAEALATEGAHVLLTGCTEEHLESNTASINPRDGGCTNYVVAGLAEANCGAHLAQAAKYEIGGVDILINNAGGPPPGQIVDADLNIVRHYMEMMVMCMTEITHQFLPGMRNQKWRRVITIAYSGVIQPILNLGISNMLRSALVGWSKSLASVLRADGVTVNVLAPGRIQTSRFDDIDAAAAKRIGGSIEDARSASYKTIPLGRYGSLQEFGAVAAFLASLPASYFTGSIVRCDGGLISSLREKVSWHLIL